MDQIHIDDLLVRCIIGVNPEERLVKQNVLISLTLTTDTRPAAASDDISDALNYFTLSRRIIKHVEQSSYYLIERLAHKIAEIALMEFGAARVRVDVQKPDILPFARAVGVTIERTPADFAAE